MSTETREDSDRNTLRAKAPTEEQKTLTETTQEVTRIADACLSLACVAFKLCVVVKWSGYVQQGTGVQLLTVDQECLLLGTDVKHSVNTKKISKQKITTKKRLSCLSLCSLPPSSLPPSSVKF